jgi:hypothetical protein
VAADRLSLWASSPPIRDDNENGLQLIDLQKGIGVRNLRPTWKISKAFPDVPAEEHIHVIVEFASQTAVKEECPKEYRCVLLSSLCLGGSPK